MNHLLQHRLFDPHQRGSETSIAIDVEYGHTYHCAARMNWGDGECECGLLEREEFRATVAFRSDTPTFDDRCDIWDADQGSFD